MLCLNRAPYVVLSVERFYVPASSHAPLHLVTGLSATGNRLSKLQEKEKLCDEGQPNVTECILLTGETDEVTSYMREHRARRHSDLRSFGMEAMAYFDYRYWGRVSVFQRSTQP
jgi:hypothetical protein